MGLTGVVPPPPGVTPDFDYSHPWLYTTNMVLIGVGLALSTGFLLLRIYTRARILHKFGPDDVAIILSWAFSVAIQSVCIYGYRRGGVGIHIWNVTQEMFNKYQKLVLVAAVIYVLALAFAKLSLIILYHRIISTKPMYKFALYVVTAIVCGYSIAIVFALIFACSPIQKNWDASITRGHCIDRDGLYIATAVTNIITDLALIILPIPVVFTLQMPRIQKLGLLMLFVIGCATFVTSILRLATLIPFQESNDITHDLAWPEAWINIESNLIVICPCLPFLRQFLRHHTPQWFNSRDGSAQLSFRGYVTGSARRSNRRQGVSRLRDEITLADNGGSGSSEAHILKDVQWSVTEERVGARVSSDGASTSRLR